MNCKKDIDELLAKYFVRETLTGEEQKEVDEWISSHREEFEKMKMLVDGLRRVNPGVPLLLTVPAENYRRVSRTYVQNGNIGKVRNTIARFAAENGVAYWDLFQVGGGKGAAGKWYANRLFNRDRIHFTAEGYELQGMLLYDALMNSYRDYLRGDAEH